MAQGSPGLTVPRKKEVKQAEMTEEEKRLIAYRVPGIPDVVLPPPPQKQRSIYEQPYKLKPSADSMRTRTNFNSREVCEAHYSLAQRLRLCVWCSELIARAGANEGLLRPSLNPSLSVAMTYLLLFPLPGGEPNVLHALFHIASVQFNSAATESPVPSVARGNCVCLPQN